MTGPVGDLTERMKALRTRSRGSGDRWLLVAGGVLIPLGVVLIVVGWYGTAQTTLTFEQAPYIVSGGLLGLGCILIGCLLYAVHWLARLARDSAANAARQAAHEERVEQLLMRLAAGGGAPEIAAALVVTRGGSMLHRPDCAATHGQVVLPAGPAAAGYELCGLCRPDPRAAEPPTGPLATAPKNTAANAARPRTARTQTARPSTRHPRARS